MVNTKRAPDSRGATFAGSISAPAAVVFSRLSGRLDGLEDLGAGAWQVRQHGWKKRRTWRKLHLGVDEATGDIIAQVTTEREVTDDAVLPELLGQVDGPLEQVTTDGAYDTFAWYAAIVAREARPVIPPAVNAKDHGTASARDRTVRRVAAMGRKPWKEESGYHRRSLAETAMFRMKPSLVASCPPTPSPTSKPRQRSVVAPSTT